MSNDYEDIIQLPHHQSHNHPRMSMDARAAQFAPFAALSGYEEAISDTEKEVLHHFSEEETNTPEK